MTIDRAMDALLDYIIDPKPCADNAPFPTRIRSRKGVWVPGYDPATYPPMYEVAGKMGVPVIYAPPTAYARVGRHVMGNYMGAVVVPATAPPVILRMPEIRMYTHSHMTYWHELAHAAHDRLGGDVEGPRGEPVAVVTSGILNELYGSPAQRWHLPRHQLHPPSPYLSAETLQRDCDAEYAAAEAVRDEAIEVARYILALQ